MSEQIQDPNTSVADELAALKERADILGISYGPRIGVDELRKRVNNKINGIPDEPAQAAPTAAPVAATEVAFVAPVKTAAQIEQEAREAHILENMALLRCRIYNLNPQKRDLRGEIITVVNRYLGKVQKFIPFGEETDNGYHIPKVIYDDLVQRTYQDIRTKEKDGKVQITRRMAPEYNIVVMDPLTPEELAELALNQAAAERVGA